MGDSVARSDSRISDCGRFAVQGPSDCHIDALALRSITDELGQRVLLVLVDVDSAHHLPVIVNRRHAVLFEPATEFRNQIDVNSPAISAAEKMTFLA